MVNILLIIALIVPFSLMVIGFCLLGLEEDKDIWSSAWNSFKNKLNKRGKNE